MANNLEELNNKLHDTKVTFTLDEVVRLMRTFELAEEYVHNEQVLDIMEEYRLMLGWQVNNNITDAELRVAEYNSLVDLI